MAPAKTSSPRSAAGSAGRRPAAPRKITPAPAVPRREARRISQTVRIIEAADSLLRSQGDAFTIQQLVDEAGCALQTFYRHFPSKDHLLVAWLAQRVATEAAHTEQAAQAFKNPVERLRYFVTMPLQNLGGAEASKLAPVITREHFRLHQLFPSEVSQATQPFNDLVERALEAANERGLASSSNPKRDAQTIGRLVMSTYHHFAFADRSDLPRANDALWSFVAQAVGASTRKPRSTAASAGNGRDASPTKPAKRAKPAEPAKLAKLAKTPSPERARSGKRR